jgi:hypothetical protein
MGPVHWVAIILAANLLYLWLFFHLDLETYPIMSRVGIKVHVTSIIGAFWMLNDWFIKRGKRQWKAWTWLAFLPWGFLWYYVEKYRPYKAIERKDA